MTTWHTAYLMFSELLDVLRIFAFSACKVNTNSQPASLLLIYEGLCAIFHSV